MSTAPAPLVVAIDGPAGAGKSTVARRLAKVLGIPFVDTGAMYRAAALHLSSRGIDLDDRAAVAGGLASLPLELALEQGAATVLLAGQSVDERIRSAEVGAMTSRLAVHAELRAFMVARQRKFVERHGGVMEGRDIGTVVVPKARCKFFLDAASSTRAVRRHAELQARGQAADFEVLQQQIVERDDRDRSRGSSPLAVAADAIVIHTDGLSVDGVVERLRVEVEKRRGSVG